MFELCISITPTSPCPLLPATTLLVSAPFGPFRATFYVKQSRSSYVFVPHAFAHSALLTSVPQNFDPRAATFEPTTTTAATAPGGTTATTVSQGQAAPQPHPGLAATAPPQAPAPVLATAGEGFGQLPDGGDISDPYAWPSARELARKLLDPPRQAYSVHHKRTGFIQIQLRWVLRTVGEPHFRNDKTLSRSVLKENSKLRTHGLVVDGSFLHGSHC